MTIAAIMTKMEFKVRLNTNIEGIITWKDIFVYYIGRNKE
jgi:hypothetical protein